MAMEEDGPPPRPAVAADVVARVTSGTAAAPREEPATVANVRSLTQFYILGFLTTVRLFCTEGDLNKISNHVSLKLNIFHA